VVVFAVTQWRPEDIQLASGLGPDSSLQQQRDWAATTLAEGMDILTSRGASVVWAPYLTTNLPEHLSWAEQPFGHAMLTMPSERADVKRIPFYHAGSLDERVNDPEFQHASAAAVLEVAAPLDRRESTESVRVLLVGDSLSASLGVGLERWADETGEATVWTTALLGCGFMPEGEIDFPGQTRFPSHCLDVQDQWRDQVRQFDPDVVVVSSTVWDLVPRKLPEWDTFRQPGDPQFDDFILDRYREAMDIFTSRGARVVWLEAPCFSGDFQAMVEQLNDHLLVQLRDEHQNLEIYPFEALACPDGQLPTELGGVSDPRPDDIHFSPDASYWIAQQMGPALVG
jgi:hypothetical protein